MPPPSRAASENKAGSCQASCWAVDSQAVLPNGQSVVQPVILVYEPGTANEETVVAVPVKVQIKPGQFWYRLQAPFTKTHNAGSVVNCYGNPGPWTRYDPRQDPGVVLHYSIIE